MTTDILFNDSDLPNITGGNIYGLVQYAYPGTSRTFTASGVYPFKDSLGDTGVVIVIPN
jgi:hypothetical protein